jgi:uncharacterized RDD family membrane protein YckC
MTTADDYISKVLEMMPRATPRRSQIATELRGHIVERVGHGQPLDDVLRHLGDPVMLAESYLAAVRLVSAPFWRRAFAKLVDVLAILAVFVPVLWLASRAEGVFPFALLFGILASSLLFGIYTVVGEHWLGQTVGKYLFDIRVVRETGTRIGVGQAIVRQLPIFLQVFWIDVLFALFTDKSQRAFEFLSKTRVVVSDPEEDE